MLACNIFAAKKDKWVRDLRSSAFRLRYNALGVRYELDDGRRCLRFSN